MLTFTKIKCMQLYCFQMQNIHIVSVVSVVCMQCQIMTLLCGMVCNIKFLAYEPKTSYTIHKVHVMFFNTVALREKKQR
jgi:hypothetical protein